MKLLDFTHQGCIYRKLVRLNDIKNLTWVNIYFSFKLSMLGLCRYNLMSWFHFLLFMFSCEEQVKTQWKKYLFNYLATHSILYKCVRLLVIKSLRSEKVIIFFVILCPNASNRIKLSNKHLLKNEWLTNMNETDKWTLNKCGIDY